MYRRLFHFLFAVGFLLSLSLSASAQAQTKVNILLLGTDSGYSPDRPAGLRPSRSDAVLIVTLDKSNEKVTISSLPRDTLVEIPGYGKEKLTHAFAYGGADLTKQSLKGLLGIDFDYYVAANMSGFVQMINAIKGITVKPPMTFSMGSFKFTQDQTIHLDGDKALAYARERYTSGGDYARQRRMRQMVAVIAQRMIQEGDIEPYRSLFENRGELIETDLTFDEIANLFKQYGKASLSFEDFGLVGSSYTDPVAGYVEVPETTSLNELKSILQ